MTRKNAGVVAGIVAAAALALAGCSPSLEQDSDLPPGSEPELSLSAPSSAAHAGEGGHQACTLEHFKVSGKSGRQPKLQLPEEECAAPAKPLVKDLDKGEGPAIKDGDTVEVNYVIHGLSGHKVEKTWKSATETKPEQIVIGEGALVPALDTALLGKKAGGRLLIVLPPDENANEKLGFEPTETLVAVIGLTRIG